MRLRKHRYLFMFEIYDELVDIVVFARSDARAWRSAKQCLVEHLVHLSKCRLVNAEEPTQQSWNWTHYVEAHA